MLLLVVKICKALVEIALLLLLGRGVLAVLAGERRQSNAAYRILSAVTDPVLRMVRGFTPKLVADAHIPLAAVLLLLMTWIALTGSKIYLVLGNRAGA